MNKIYKVKYESQGVEFTDILKEYHYNDKERAIKEFTSLKSDIINKYGNRPFQIIVNDNNIQVFNGALNSWIELDLSEIEVI